MSKDTKDDYKYILDKIDIKKDEYISNLIDPKDIYKRNVFNGLISYIGSLFSDNKYLQDTISLDYKNFDLLDILFDKYVALSCLYNHAVYLSSFSIFINLSQDILYHWVQGDTKLTPDAMRKLQKWRKAAENAQETSDSVKSMFLLKAKYGYSEEQTQTPQQTVQVSQLPPADGLLLPEQN